MRDNEPYRGSLVPCPHCGHWLWANTHHCPGCCYQFRRGPIEHCLRRTFRHIAELPYVIMGLGILMLVPYAPRACQMEGWPTDALSIVGLGLIVGSCIAGEIITAVNRGRCLFIRGIWPFPFVRGAALWFLLRERKRRSRHGAHPACTEPVRPAGCSSATGNRRHESCEGGDDA